jgi:hypothetical protein
MPTNRPSNDIRFVSRGREVLEPPEIREKPSPRCPNRRRIDQERKTESPPPLAAREREPYPYQELLNLSCDWFRNAGRHYFEMRKVFSLAA